MEKHLEDEMESLLLGLYGDNGKENGNYYHSILG